MLLSNLLILKANDNKLRKRKLESIASRHLDGNNQDDTFNSKKKKTSTAALFPTFELQRNIRNLKSVLKNILLTTTDPSYQTEPNIDFKGIDMLRGEIGMDAFKNLMRVCDLPHLATKEVFRIFDINKDGTIELKEFLLVCFS